MDRIAPTDQARDRHRGEAFLKQSKTVCMAAWVHVHLSSLGDFTPCCEIFQPLGTSEGATLVSHWNSKAMADLRNAMLQDAPIQMCRKCYDKEEAGLHSSRLRYNDFYRDEVDRLNATRPDGTLPASVQPIDLDIRFSNLCNFRCRSCWHGASSRWFSDASALGLAQGPSPVITAGADRRQLLAEVLERLPLVRSIYFAGGEPLLMEEHYALLEQLIRIGRTDVLLSYNSNFSELSLGNRRVADLWAAFPHVEVEASADGMGAVGELVRKGFSSARFEENLLAVRETCPHVKLSLRITVSVLNLFHLPNFYRYAHERLGFGHDMICVNPLQEPRHYNIRILPRAMRKAAAVQLTALARSLPESPPPLVPSRRPGRAGKAALLDLISYMGNGDNGGGIAKFVQITEALDALRGEDTFATIPELAGLRAMARRARTAWGRAANALARLV
jgi:hypothetical protein